MKYDFNDERYKPVKEKILSYHDDDGHKWEDIKNFSWGIIPKEIMLAVIINDLTKFNNNLSVEEWEGLVSFVEETTKKEKAPSLASGALNDAKISISSVSQWKQYKKKLQKQGFSATSIHNIQVSSYSILQRLNKDTSKSEPVKGLVVGNVQSGKTANMSGLISMAADYGFNYFIIFSGVIDNLRQQTARRMFDDLDGEQINSKFSWTELVNPSLRSNENPLRWENIDFSDGSSKRYFTVCLKNNSRMKQLIKWLYDDENKMKQAKVLIIDDEADQASINTKHFEEERTAINKAMMDLVNGPKGKKKLGAVNYISYTATPFANVLNEVGKESLYPKDFIFSLTPSEDYIGPREIFGIEVPEQESKVEIVRGISQEDYNQIKLIHDGKESKLPESFKDAIDWFFLAASAMRALKYKKPVSMLIHTSQRVIHHKYISEAVEIYLQEAKANQSEYFERLKRLYKIEANDFQREDFIERMIGYSTPNEVPEYPEWENVLDQIELVFLRDEEYISHIQLDEDKIPKYHHGFHVVIDNSRAKADKQIVRLVYPDKKTAPNFAPMFIVVGGNTLSRGLTLEGLVSSYFLRTTNQADTLMQMGRWFGFRKKYEIFPRIWMDSKTRERFVFLSQMNEELRDEITELSQRGETPLTYQIRVKNSPDRSLIKLTSANKMYGAIESNLNFTGFNKQTVIFTNSKEILESNIVLTEDFLNSLDNPKVPENKSKYICWKNVRYNKIREFLTKFHFSEKDIAFSKIDKFLEWYDKVEADSQFTEWSVVFASKGEMKPIQNDNQWNIAGYSAESIIRSRRGDIQDDGKTASIGVLRSPADLYADIEEYEPADDYAKTSAIHRIREEYGYGNTPLLVLYRVDKNSEAKAGSKLRHNLEFDADIIGMNLLIPGVAKNKNIAEYMVVDISSAQYDDFDVTEFQDDDE
ncbi:Z1 domain-containing protein [Enterococcus faecium]|uniref:Z1 domain-containing protein n=1 Tax=Enterococcus faecium TaxID=1352 RepID=UPI00032FC061|nr:Z1 domain-containing protein [Enterococcus faecium]EKZ0100418.1 Z1 domain-containing protein [Enterococcus faecium]EME8081113.1 Z1 domain-containing protein [Enterococcus faecium]EOG03869.1 hypothetical protein SKQ_01578 [Enterococcus faecium EnGen0171]EOK12616.1 hypothetical protein WOY_01266 [Enterococcus faecium EnGen0372]EOM39335.1 hypothetical protein SKS_01170 [Enterococcus faecium EnGen0172]